LCFSSFSAASEPIGNSAAGGGKGKVTHWGGDGGDGRLEIYYTSALSIDQEKIQVGDGTKVIVKATYDEFWDRLLPYIRVKFGRDLLAEYMENGSTPDQERIIHHIDPAYSLDLLERLVSELEYNVVNEQDARGMYIDCAQVVPGLFPHLDDIKTNPFLTVRKTADDRVDFDRSVFVATAEVVVVYKGAELGRHKYKFLAGKWPTKAERTKIIARGPSPHPPPLGYMVGLQRAGEKEWTVITQERLRQAAGLPVEYSKFICFDWSLGIMTKAEDEGPTVFRNNHHADTEYGKIGLSLDEPFQKEGAKVILMRKPRAIEHAFRDAGFDCYSSKLGKNELILHLYEHMHLPTYAKDRDKSLYGEAYRSYR
jgi:hypothetical protein